jgi:hypothetical protein
MRQHSRATMQCEWAAWGLSTANDRASPHPHKAGSDG